MLDDIETADRWVSSQQEIILSCLINKKEVMMYQANQLLLGRILRSSLSLSVAVILCISGLRCSDCIVYADAGLSAFLAVLSFVETGILVGLESSVVRRTLFLGIVRCS